MTMEIGSDHEDERIANCHSIWPLLEDIKLKFDYDLFNFFWDMGHRRAHTHCPGEL